MWLDVFGGIYSIVFYVFCGVSAIIVVVGIIAIIAPCCLPHVNHYTPGGSIDFFTIMGGKMIAVTVLLRAINPTWTNIKVLQTFCELYPAPLLVGMTLFLGGLLVKGATIYSYQWYKRPSTLSGEWKANLAMWALVIAIAIAAAVWCALFTPFFEEVAGPKYKCYNRQAGFEWKTATSVWFGVLLLAALIITPMQSMKSRKRPCRPESVALSVAVINAVLCVVAGICVHYLYPTTPTIYYAIIGGLQLWMVLLADIVMLAGKITVAKREMNAINYEDERYDTIQEDVSGF